jgi:hypothetical protein
MTLHPGPVLVAQQTLQRELSSARPDAPQRAHTARPAAQPRLRRTRSAAATALHRAAHRVAPA